MKLQNPLSPRQWLATGLIFYLLVAPFLTFIHELGHALPALAQGMKVKIGIGDYVETPLVLGRLKIGLGSLLYPWYGYTRWNGAGPNPIALLGGPLASLLTAVLIRLYLKRNTRPQAPVARALLWAALGWSIWQFIWTALPIRHPEWLPGNPFKVSDGYQIMEQLRARL